MNTGQSIDLRRGWAPTYSFPLKHLADCASEVLAGSKGLRALQYSDPQGLVLLREWLAERHQIHPDQVLVGHGSLHLLDLVVRVLLPPHGTLVVEAPTYDRALRLLRVQGFRVLGVPIDDAGADLDVLEHLARRYQPSAVYLIPDFQNPTGVTISAARRLKLLELAERFDLLIVEDAAYRSLRYQGQHVPSFFSDAPHRTIHISSFSKQLCPGLRVGYVLGTAHAIKELRFAAETSYLAPNGFAQAVVLEFCIRGWLDKHQQYLRQLYAPRMEAMVTCLMEQLPDSEWTRPEGGFFVAANVRVPVVSLLECAERHGLLLLDGQDFWTDPKRGSHFLRLPIPAYSSVLIRAVTIQLAACIAEVSQAKA